MNNISPKEEKKHCENCAGKDCNCPCHSTPNTESWEERIKKEWNDYILNSAGLMTTEEWWLDKMGKELEAQRQEIVEGWKEANKQAYERGRTEGIREALEAVKNAKVGMLGTPSSQDTATIIKIVVDTVERSLIK